MRVDCPECAAKLDGTPGAEMVCPACMTPFLVPAEERQAHIFEVQPADAPVLHGMTRAAIREAIYVGRLGPSARVRPEGGTWQLIGGFPEFAAVLRVLGGDLAPMPGTRKLGSWKREEGTESPPVRHPPREEVPAEPPHTPVIRPRAATEPPRPTRAPPPPPPGTPAWVMGVAVLGGLAGAVALAAWLSG